LRDFNRLMRQIDAVQVVLEDQVGDRIFQLGNFLRRKSRAGQTVDDQLVVRVERFVGPDQKCAAAAGWLPGCVHSHDERCADRNV
jgi:hypothetical protein